MSNDYHSPRGFNILPPVVKNLLIINGLFFLATLVVKNTMNIDLTDTLGLHYFKSPLFKPYQLVTHFFMHGGWAHIFFNMFALWMFGNAIENVWGGKRFLIYYLVTGFGAAFIHLAYTSWQLHDFESAISVYQNAPTLDAYAKLVRDYVPTVYGDQFQGLISAWQYHPESSEYVQRSVSLINEMYEIKMNTPTVGASGAVFGVLLAFGMMFPNSVIYVYFAIPIKAKYFVMLYGALELYNGIQSSPQDNVAHFAHLGGMLFGYFLIRYWNKKSHYY